MGNHAMVSYIFLVIFLDVVPLLSSAECTCDHIIPEIDDKAKTIKYKLVAILSILIASGVGVCLPIVGKKISCFNPENNIFFLIKAFAAGVILATGFVHILADAFESLKSCCIKDKPWGDFPLAGFVAMVSAIMTMMIDCFATSYYKNCHFNNKALPVRGDEELQGKHEGHVHVHTHVSHGHAHGSASLSDLHSGFSTLSRHRVVSQVLELGIVIHSVAIGISLGASEGTNTIKALVAALTFHQFFEGMGLGGCISQAQFNWQAVAIMVAFFSLTTPIGIGIGIGISNTYNEYTAKALIVEGILNSASAGILIYMALVDLLAQEFMNPKLQANFRLQIAAYLSLLLGMGCMSVLAKWA